MDFVSGKTASGESQGTGPRVVPDGPERQVGRELARSFAAIQSWHRSTKFPPNQGPRRRFLGDLMDPYGTFNRGKMGERINMR